MSSKKIFFKNAAGYKLSARLQLPVDRHPVAYAVFAHCFTCNKNLTPIRQISEALAGKGFGVLRFDFTGLGESEGAFADTDFSSNIEDLLAVAQYMEAELEAPKLLIGHSLGGAAVLLAARSIPSVQAVATIAAPSHPEHVKKLVFSGIAEIQQTGSATVQIGGRPFTIKKQFLDDLVSQPVAQSIQKLDKALLILHSPQDVTVGIGNAADIYMAARHPKSFISLDGADHLLSNKQDAVYAGEVVATWAQRYIKIEKPVKLESEKQVMVQTGKTGYTSRVKAGKHSFVADEPEQAGGNDFGPTPYDFLLAALGSCTAMTLRMYADRKQWDVTEINVHLSHGHTHIRDGKDCENPGAKIERIERWIEIEGEVDEKQKARLLDIADKCPVHKTLTSNLEIKTQWVKTNTTDENAGQ